MPNDVAVKYLGPEDPRPDGKPLYIDRVCNTCGSELVLLDLLDDPSATEEEIWHDEFACPKCRDGVHLDWPKTALDEMDRDTKFVLEKLNGIDESKGDA